jgi:hypothetical protein
MADLITLKAIVKLLNTDLNALSITLKADTKIDRAIPFAIVPHYQDNEEDKAWSEDVRIGAVAVRLNGSFSPSQQYVGYRDRILVTFDAFTKDANDMDYILNEYARQYTGKFFKLDDWIYQATFEKPSFINRNVDAGEQRVSIFFEIQYDFVFKGIVSDDITLKINNVSVPVLSYVSKIEKKGPTGDVITVPGKDTSRFTTSMISKTFKFIHINNAEINKVLEDVDSGDFLNREYEIFYGVSCVEVEEEVTCLYDNGTITMVISNGGIEFAEGTFQTIEATFLLYKSLG